MRIPEGELGEFLEFNYQKYHQPWFRDTDPVSVPHLFSKREDIEIAGLFAATLAWGNRKSIVANARRLMLQMDDAPHDFIMHASERDFNRFGTFVHRTFNGEDCIFFLRALKHIYGVHASLEELFSGFNSDGALASITSFRSAFLSVPHAPRSGKHLSDPSRGSAAKRINMFLRWMVRSAEGGVDFGLWRTISPAGLICPLDIHSGNVARKLGLLERKQNDWRAATELTASLRRFDQEDPVKFDIALFGLGVHEKF